jgi:hypothetical protein
MQNSQGSYEKTILILCSLAALGAAAYLVLQSKGFEESLTLPSGASANNPNPPNVQGVQDAIDTIKKKYSWVSPVRNGKPVPLNKSVLLVMKDGGLFDLTLPEPKFREPMTNVFLVGDRTKTPPEEQLPHLFSPNVGDLDADNDGFSNLEEFEAKTNPRDANDLPPLTNKLFLKQRISHDYMVKLVSGDGKTFQVQRLEPQPRASKFVALNEEFGFERGVTRFKVLSAEKKQFQHPTLGPMDAQVLKIKDLSTNKEFELTEKGDEVNLAEYEAVFEFQWKTRSKIAGVREGKTFVLPGVVKTYHILKLEDSKAIIAPDQGGKPSSQTIEIKQG